MIKRLLDSYYLVLTRWYNATLNHRVIGIMVLTLGFNFLSLLLLIYPDIMDYFIIAILVFVLSGWIIDKPLSKRYTLDFRDKMMEEYKDEKPELREQKATWVVVYIILTLAFLIWVISRFAQ